MKKLKAITFSYDDGVEQDKRLIKILDRYSIKSTFNLNSGLFNVYRSHDATLLGKSVTFHNYRIPIDEIKQVYENHEVAAHSVSHPNLTQITDDEVVYQMKEDAINLEKLTGNKMNGFAYPGGRPEYYDERVKRLIKDNTELYYGRTVKSNYSFDLQEDLMIFQPTVSHIDIEMREKLAREFLALETDKPQIFYMWGHSYELDVDEKVWTEFERFCELIAEKDDIYYGTNDQVFEYFGLK